MCDPLVFCIASIVMARKQTLRDILSYLNILERHTYGGSNLFMANGFSHQHSVRWTANFNRLAFLAVAQFTIPL